MFSYFVTSNFTCMLVPKGISLIILCWGSVSSFSLFYDSGYMSPKYAMQELFSIKSDVYSFGVLLLEIITGKKNSTYHHDGPSSNLIEHVSTLANNDYKIKPILLSLICLICFLRFRTYGEKTIPWKWSTHY